jgi:hypothetical protein
MEYPSQNFIVAPSTADSAAAFIADWVARLGDGILVWAEASRSANSAAVLYDSLSRLPDLELARRGMTRCDVNRQVFDHLMGNKAARPREGGLR